MTSSYQQLAERFRKISRIGHAITYLSWDQMVLMPEEGVAPRADALAELAALQHEWMTDESLATVFDQAEQEVEGEEALSLQEMKYAWLRETCLPAELVREKIKAGSRCEHAWRTQRGNNDWDGFTVNFKPVLELAREEARLRQAAAPERFPTPYDSLLDLHCSGDSKALIDSVFSDLRAELPDLLKEVMERQSKKSTSQLAGVFPIEHQQQLNEELMSLLGFDFNSGRLDVSTHPFSTGDRGDLRITTRFEDDEFLQALLATAHETGHASYQGGLPAAWEGLPVGSYRNMCIHESQSLLFEKQVFLSRAFLGHFKTHIDDLFPDLATIPADDLWRSATRVEPGFIRVEADEVTYPLHVLLRYEIESELINGSLEVQDIPDCWNEKMQSYLGLSTAGNYADGCLQDIHWTDGAFGYFPSYTLGAVNSAQIFATVKGQFEDWEERFAKGELGFLREWLSENIWSKGCLESSQGLMQSATGQGTNPAYYLQHLRDRYLDSAY